MLKKIAALVVAMGCLAVGAAESFATTVGSYAATWLALPRGVRNIGMGATGTADASGLATGYFNPASMAWSDATTLLASRELYGTTDITLSEILIASPIPFKADAASAWHFAGSFGYARLGMGPQYQRTIFLPEGMGQTFDPTDWMLSATGASSWTHGIMTLGAGGAARYVRQGMADSDVSGWTFDVGTMAAFPIALENGLIRPRIGYAALNLDTGMSYSGRTAYIPTEQRLGFGLDFELGRVPLANRFVPAAALSFDYDHIHRDGWADLNYSSGVEVSALGIVHVRYGTINDDYTTFGVGLGWDVGSALLRVDYAHLNSGGGVDYNDYDRDTFGALIGVRW